MPTKFHFINASNGWEKWKVGSWCEGPINIERLEKEKNKDEKREEIDK